MKALRIVLAQYIIAVVANGAILTVINTDDSGPGSLPQALTDAIAGDTIDFDLPLPSVISLTDNFFIDKDIQIVGPGANLLTIQNDENTVSFGQVIQVQDGHVVGISGITITKGSFSGVQNFGTLTLSNCAVTGNSDNDFDGAAGGIVNSGTLTLLNCTVANNSGFYDTGGIESFGSLIMTNCTISGNATTRGSVRGMTGFDPPANPGAGLYAAAGSAVITDCTFTANQASVGGAGIYSGF